MNYHLSEGQGGGLSDLQPNLSCTSYLHLLYTQITYSPSPKIPTAAKTQGLTVEEWAEVIGMPTVHKTVDTFDALETNCHSANMLNVLRSWLALVPWQRHELSPWAPVNRSNKI